jgi:hypothetical protein
MPKLFLIIKKEQVLNFVVGLLRGKFDINYIIRIKLKI